MTRRAYVAITWPLRRKLRADYMARVEWLRVSGW